MSMTMGEYDPSNNDEDEAETAFETLLNEYLDGTLEMQSRLRLEAHLNTHPEAATKLAELRHVFTQLDDLPEVPLWRSLAPSVVAALPKAQKPQMRLPRPYRLALFAQAIAGIVVLIALALPLVASIQLPPDIPSFQLLISLSPIITDIGNIIVSAQALLTGLSKLVAPQQIQSLWPLGMCLGLIALIWGIGNGLLLRNHID